MVFDTSLLFTLTHSGEELLMSPESKGHIIESAVGAYLLMRSKTEHFEVFWWRQDNRKVDFVISRGDEIVAIEVKSGRIKGVGGLLVFKQKFPNARLLVVGDLNNSVEAFLSGDVPLFKR